MSTNAHPTFHPASPVAHPNGDSINDDSGSSLLHSALLLGAASAVAISAFNRVIFARVAPLGNRLGGVFDRYPARLGDMAYTVRGEGSPVLFLHGFGAGNSMAEWEQNIDAIAAHHTVYAFDFLGWGLSDKPRTRHSAEDYIEATLNFLEDVVDEPCALVASSQAANLAVEVAGRAPQRVSKLVLICPSPTREDAAASPPGQLISALLSVPGLNTSAYNFIASRNAIQQFARQHLFFDKSRVDERFIDQYYSAAHQSNAPFGVYSFLSGAFDIDVRSTWSALSMPALLVWGRNALLSPLDSAPEWMALKPDARLEVIDHAMLQPHVEHPQRFNALTLRWLRDESDDSGAENHALAAGSISVS